MADALECFGHGCCRAAEVHADEVFVAVVAAFGEGDAGLFIEELLGLAGVADVETGAIDPSEVGGFDMGDSHTGDGVDFGGEEIAVLA